MDVDKNNEDVLETEDALTEDVREQSPQQRENNEQSPIESPGSSHTSYHSPDHTDEDTNCIKNKLILGSKPSPTNTISSEPIVKNVAKKSTAKSSVVAMQNMSSDLARAKVNLELNLTASSPGNKRSRNDESDDYVVNKVARTSTTEGTVHLRNTPTRTSSTSSNNSTLCSHCNLMFNNKDDLIKHLFEQLPANQQESAASEENFLIERDTATQHEDNELDTEQVEDEDAQETSESGEGDSEYTLLQSSNNNRNCKLVRLPTIPGRLSVYYCKHCNNSMHRVHGIHYSKQCKESLNNCICLFCGLSFSIKSMPSHYKYHEKTPITLKDIDMYSIEDMKLVLPYPMPNYYRCNNCNINYESKTNYLNHICDEDFNKCEYCGELFYKSLYPVHKIFHSLETSHSTKAGLEKLHNHISDKNVDASSNNSKAKSRNDYKIVVYKCLKCNVVVTKFSISLKHKCIPEFEKRTCHICNLVYAIYQKRAHKQLHRDYPYLQNDQLYFKMFKPQDKISNSLSSSMEDTVYPSLDNNSADASKNPRDISTTVIQSSPSTSQREVQNEINGIRIISSKTILYKCLDCDIIINSGLTSKDHKCIPLKDKRYCKLCKQKYSYDQEASHQRLHDIIPDFIFENIEIVPFNSNNKLSECVSEIPKKIDMIIFLCMQCKVATDSYDRVVEHSQYHLNISNKKFTSVQCSQCSLFIENDYLIKHKQQHSETKSDEDFKIYIYDPEKLLDKSWFDLFSDIPEDKKRNILNHSVYNEVRNVILNLKKDGKSLYTIYTCAKCETAVSKDDISRHLSSKCNKSETVCSQCDIGFNQDSYWKEHQQIHNSGVDSNDFRVLTFQTDVGRPNNSRKYTIYKCNKCHVSVFNQKNVQIHVCVPQKHRRVCNKCNQILGYKSMGKHHCLHKKFLDFNEDNIGVEYFNPDSLYQNDQLVATNDGNTFNQKNDPKMGLSVFKCKDCSLIVFSKVNALRHKCVSNRYKTFCKKCQQFYACQRSTLHKTKHQQYPDFVPGQYNVIPFESRNKLNKNINNTPRQLINIKSDNEHNLARNIEDNCDSKLIVYKCSDCYLIVFSERSVLNHRCAEDKYKTFCYKCKQYFASPQKSAHKKMHEKYRRFAAGRFSIIPFESKNKLTQNNEEKIITNEEENIKTCVIYKCACGLHFLTQDTIKLHMEASCEKITGKCRSQIDAQECSKCGLLFPTDFLCNHLFNHHKRNTEITIKEVNSSEFSTLVSPTHRLGSKTEATKFVDVSNEPKPGTLRRGSQSNNADKTHADTLSTSNTARPPQSKTKETKPLNSSSECTQDSSNDEDQILIFKCVECDVYFLTQIECAMHTKTHSKLDPVYYMECKICSLQFHFESLSKHIKEHHKTRLNLKSAIVEEYTPVEGAPPKTRLAKIKLIK